MGEESDQKNIGKKTTNNNIHIPLRSIAPATAILALPSLTMEHSVETVENLPTEDAVEVVDNLPTEPIKKSDTMLFAAVTTGAVVITGNILGH